jgi:hypothetical protein
LKVKLAILYVITIGGFFILLQSVNLGESSTHSWINQMGGSTDNDIYITIFNNYISIYRLIGISLFSIGLYFLLDWSRKTERNTVKEMENK